VYCQVRC